MRCTDRHYIIDMSLEMNRRDFENWLLELIKENSLTANEIPALGTGVTIERSVRHHPLRCARQMGLNVETYEVVTEM